MIGSKYIKEAGIVMIPTNCQNWLALGACVYADMSVSKALRMLGLVNFTKGVKQSHRKPIDMDKAIELREQGMTYQKIGEIMNVSFTTIRERLIEIGYNEVKK